MSKQIKHTRIRNGKQFTAGGKNEMFDSLFDEVSSKLNKDISIAKKELNQLFDGVAMSKEEMTAKAISSSDPQILSKIFNITKDTLILKILKTNIHTPSEIKAQIKGVDHE